MKYSLADFCSLLVQPTQLLSFRIIYIQTNSLHTDYFVSYVVSRTSQLYAPTLTFQVISLIDSSLEEIKQEIATSFLGQQKIILFTGLVDIPDKKYKQRLHEVITTYPGIHTLMICDNALSLPSGNAHVTVHADTTKPSVSLLIQLAQLLKLPVSSRLVSVLHAGIDHEGEQISLHEGLIVLLYSFIAGKSGDLFIQDWLPQLIPPQAQLFSLSHHFFVRDIRAFFDVWSTIVSQYQAHFWTSFWSEQLWRAYAYIDLMKHKDFAAARSLSFRLPVVFTKRAWRQHTAAELRGAHEFLVTIDQKIKLGQTPYWYDLFYAKFFQGRFGNIQ